MRCRTMASVVPPVEQVQHKHLARWGFVGQLWGRFKTREFARFGDDSSTRDYAVITAP